MGFLDLFRRKPDPTATWRAEPGLRLEFDFSSQALCGVRIGESLERLARLGPAEDKRAGGRGRYCYYSKGLEIGAAAGLADSFLLVWDSPAEPRYRPFAGTCMYRGRDLGLSARTSEADIRQCFGEPYWRDQDEDEILLFYEFRSVEWMIELSPHRTLRAVQIVTPPLLADEGQRAAYKVTKPWPP